jgi:hypothetical protein
MTVSRLNQLPHLCRDCLADTVEMVPTVPMAPPEQRVTRAQPVLSVEMGRMVPQAQPVLLVLLELPVPLVLLAQPAPMVMTVPA